jgi:hypothetical protein
MLPLTAAAWIDLKLVGHKFVNEGKPGAADALEYIWRNCDNYSPVKNASSEKCKKRIGFLFGMNGEDEMLAIAYRHINDAFAELPIPIKSSKGVSRKNTMPAIEGIIGAIDEVSSRYGQNPVDVLAWPLNRVFQLQKAIRMATIPDYKLAEPQIIKTIKSEILNELNNGTKGRT